MRELNNKPFVGKVKEHDGNIVMSPSVRGLKRGSLVKGRKKSMIKQYIPLCVVVTKGKGKKKVTTIINGISRLHAENLKVDGVKKINVGKVVYHDPSAFDALEQKRKRDENN